MNEHRHAKDLDEEERVNPLILIVEDESQIAEIIEGYLRQEHYRTERAKDGEQALTVFRSVRPDLIILDLMLPKLGGIEVLRTVRQDFDTPVICVTARADEVDQLLSLELGADDYITKPFRPRELMARVRAVLRRTGTLSRKREDPPIRIGMLEIDPIGFNLKVGHKKLEVTPTEFRLLYTLAYSIGKVFTRLELIEVAMPESSALERVVDAHLMSLRKKLEQAGMKNIVHTVRGVGYKIEA
ncbi:MAG: response regulator transcription factor [Deinococcaceae bacterium]